MAPRLVLPSTFDGSLEHFPQWEMAIRSVSFNLQLEAPAEGALPDVVKNARNQLYSAVVSSMTGEAQRWFNSELRGDGAAGFLREGRVDDFFGERQRGVCDFVCARPATSTRVNS